MTTFDPGALGHSKRKPTTIGHHVPHLHELHGMSGNGNETIDKWSAEPDLEKRLELTGQWAAWAPGFKAALVAALQRWLRSLPTSGEADEGGRDAGALRGCGELRDGGDLLQEGAKLTKMKPADEATWREHFLNEHLPHQRDYRHCVQAQARSKPHPRLVHAAAYTLSVDMSGRMKQGEDQHRKKGKYLLVGTYTYPVDWNGKPMAGWQVEEEGHDLPPEDWKDDGEGDAQPMPEDDLLLEEDVAEIGEVEEEDKKRYMSGVSALSTWEKMVVDGKGFGIKTLTFAEVVSGRTVPEIIPAIASMYAQLRSLGLHDPTRV